MKTVARITLKAGDILGEDILNSQGERIYAKGTKLDLKALDRLARYNVMAVTIMEDIDFAETHTEKVKASDDFKNFKNVYYECVPVFRKIIDNLVIDHTTPPIDQLMGLYIKLASNAPTGDKLLEYLVNIPPDMENMIYEHMLNCGMIASVFGNWLGLSKQELFMFIQCGFLYDVGKLCLPKELIYKPSKLTNEEFDLMKTHTTLGSDLLSEVGLGGTISKCALQHHEKGDGSGYPNHLTIGDIDNFAQYMSIIDAYEAMSAPKTYRFPLNVFEIIANFQKDAVKYNKIKLEAILFHIASTQLGLHAKLNDGREGDVIFINNLNCGRPMLRDENGIIIDLNNEPETIYIYALF